MHALVVGGTGMLKRVSLFLNQQEWTTSVVARNPIRLNELVNESHNPDLMNKLQVDWKQKDDFLKVLSQAILKDGPFDLIVYWSAREVLSDVLELNSNHHEGQWDFYHVKGSNASRPETRNVPEVPMGCHYHEIILGFQIEENNTRWLTHSEISNGVIEAIENGNKRKIIGTVEPWDMRPNW